MALFQVKTGWKRPRRRKNKNYRSIPFLTDAKLKIQKKIAKKFKGLKKYHYAFILSKNRLENAEKERI